MVRPPLSSRMELMIRCCFLVSILDFSDSNSVSSYAFPDSFYFLLYMLSLYPQNYMASGSTRISSRV